MMNRFLLLAFILFSVSPLWAAPKGSYIVFKLTASTVAFPGADCLSPSGAASASAAVSNAKISVSLTKQRPAFGEYTVVSPLGGRLRLLMPQAMRGPDTGIEQWLYTPEIPGVPRISTLAIMDAPGMLQITNQGTGSVTLLNLDDTVEFDGFIPNPSPGCWYEQSYTGPVISLPDGSFVGLCQRPFAMLGWGIPGNYSLSICRDKPQNRMLFSTPAHLGERDGTYERMKPNPPVVAEYPVGWIPAGDNDINVISLPY